MPFGCFPKARGPPSGRASERSPKGFRNSRREGLGAPSGFRRKAKRTPLRLLASLACLLPSLREPKGGLSVRVRGATEGEQARDLPESEGAIPEGKRESVRPEGHLSRRIPLCSPSARPSGSEGAERRDAGVRSPSGSPSGSLARYSRKERSRDAGFIGHRRIPQSGTLAFPERNSGKAESYGALGEKRNPFGRDSRISSLSLARVPLSERAPTVPFGMQPNSAL